METMLGFLAIALYAVLVASGLVFHKDQNRQEFEREYRRFILGRVYDAQNWKTEDISHEKTAD